MVQNLNNKAMAEANKTMRNIENNDNGSEQQTEGNNQKRVHWNGTQLQGQSTHTCATAPRN